MREKNFQKLRDVIYMKLEGRGSKGSKVDDEKAHRSHISRNVDDAIGIPDSIHKASSRI